MLSFAQPTRKATNPWWFGVTGLLWSDTFCHKHPRPKECMLLLYAYQVIFKDLCLTLESWLLAQTSQSLLEVMVSRFV